ncbi:MAG TPA: hypothetical protein VFN35_01980 [Ktedonobacteraceae bacterium]|nr:hypothetical protein [Ktedonobacteraceae bacterium]
MRKSCETSIARNALLCWFPFLSLQTAMSTFLSNGSWLLIFLNRYQRHLSWCCFFPKKAPTIAVMLLHNLQPPYAMALRSRPPGVLHAPLGNGDFPPRRVSGYGVAELKKQLLDHQAPVSMGRQIRIAPPDAPLLFLD